VRVEPKTIGVPDNTNWRGGGSGGLEGHVSKLKTWTVSGLAGCTEDKIEGRAGGLHKKAMRWAAKKGGAGCRKGQPSGPPFSATQFYVQPAGSP